MRRPIRKALKRVISRSSAPKGHYTQRAVPIMRRLITELRITVSDAAAALGNVVQESQVNPNAIGRGGDYGICQWMYDRRTRLFALARKLGLPPNNMDVQVKHLIWELQNTHKHAFRALINSSNLDSKTIAFCNKFEVPHPAHANYPKRLQYARECFAAYKKAYP